MYVRTYIHTPIYNYLHTYNCLHTYLPTDGRTLAKQLGSLKRAQCMHIFQSRVFGQLSTLEAWNTGDDSNVPNPSQRTGIYKAWVSSLGQCRYTVPWSVWVSVFPQSHQGASFHPSPPAIHASTTKKQSMFITAEDR